MHPPVGHYETTRRATLVSDWPTALMPLEVAGRLRGLRGGVEPGGGVSGASAMPVPRRNVGRVLVAS